MIRPDERNMPSEDIGNRLRPGERSPYPSFNDRGPSAPNAPSTSNAPSAPMRDDDDDDIGNR
jgi:hypothetical protein